MLLERRSRPVRGVRLITRESAPFGTQVVPLRMLTVDEVRTTLDRLPEDSGPIVTSALTTAEQKAFLDAGFEERESLHLLRHDFADRPSPVRTARLRSGRRSDRRRVLEIDHASFDGFWRLDKVGLTAARRATPVHRYRIALLDGRIVGYAIAGLAGTSSYLQRLAVDPDIRGRGIGRQLVSDAIDWAISKGSLQMMVNTQMSNAGALRLYRTLGFELDVDTLKVLEWRPH